MQTHLRTRVERTDYDDKNGSDDDDEHSRCKAQEASSVYLLPTMFVKHFPGQLLVGLMVEEGKGGPMILTKGKLKKKCFKLLII